MSGRKVTMASVPQSTLDSLYASQSRLRELESSIPEMRRNMEANYRNRLQTISRENATRIQNLDSQITGLGKEMARQENALRNELRMQAQNLNNACAALSGQLNDLGLRTVEGFKQVRQDMDRAINVVRSEMAARVRAQDKKIADLDGRVQNLEAAQEYARDQSAQWLDYARQQLGVIKNLPMRERFAPGRMQTLEKDLQGAQTDFQRQAYQASLPEAKSVSANLGQLRMDVELAHALWQQTRILALAKAENLGAYIESNREVPAVDSDGQQIPGINLDTDHWSCGKYKVIKDKLARDYAIIRDDSCPWTTAQLESWLEKVLPVYEHELEDAIQQARIGALLSQYRTEMGYELLDAFCAQGYALEGGEPLFENLDERNPLVMDLVARDGARVAIRIAPSPDGIKNSVEINSFDIGQITESQLRHRQRDASKILHDRLGLEMGITTEEAQPDSAVPKAFATARAARMRGA